MNPRPGHIYLYGPPGSGKTTVGRALAEALGIPFVDLDAQIEAGAGQTITEIMQALGEPAFRKMESAALQKVVKGVTAVISLGGGALLAQENRDCAESSGRVVVLDADLDVLVKRLNNGSDSRPLLAGNVKDRLVELMVKRRPHYESFGLRIANDVGGPDEVARRIQTLLGEFHIRQDGNGYDVLIQRDGLDSVGEFLRELEIDSPVAIVADSNVGPLYAERVEASLKAVGLHTSTIIIPAGEENKTLDTVYRLWEQFLQGGLDRKSLVLALGGGVTGDLAGFAASTYMRGIDWVGLPTSLLAMVDSSLGGKTGFDLPYGKNLVGTFHSPRLVLADPATLSSLPPVEFHSGLAEVMKHGVIADAELFALGANGEKGIADALEEVIRRAVAVKVAYVQADPWEHGRRAALNYGHTVGHAIEMVSGFRLRHGEAVAIGMVVEAELAEKLSLARKGLAKKITQALEGLGLPTQIPSDLPRQAIIETMQVDKKKQAGKVRFSLPIKIGEVKTGVEVADLHSFFSEGR